MSLAEAGTIDIHAHAVLEETFNFFPDHGPELGEDADGRPWFRICNYRLNGVRYRGSPFMDTTARIAAMDRAGIDFQVMSPNPLTFFHYLPASDGARFCKFHNDVLARTVAPHANRLAAFAQLPMQDPVAAIEELHRAVGELGMLGAYVGMDFPLPLDDASYDPLYQAFVELDVPLFLHPGSVGIEGPPADPRMKRYELDLLIGYGAQETLAVASLIFGGVLERHPKLDICVSHGGGAAMYLWGRTQHATHKRAWVPGWLQADGAFEEMAARLWYDVHVHDPRSLDLLIERVGQDRLVFGTNFAGWDAPDRVESIATTAPLTANAKRLLRASRTSSTLTA